MLSHLSFNNFTNRTGISQSDLFRGWQEATGIVSLRQLEVEDLRVMPTAYLKQILQSVTLNGTDTQPYLDCEIETGRIDPSLLRIAQTFVERPKYQAMLEKFSALFRNFCVTKGVAKCTALIAYGRTSDGKYAVSHYLPPIVERHQEMLLLDGIHRNFLVMTVGTTLESIVIHGVKADFPCTPQRWSKITISEQKPPREERFFNLQPSLFRNLEGVGIDG